MAQYSVEIRGQQRENRVCQACFLIGEDGHVYEGRGWHIKGDHTGPTWNPISIGITFMGNYIPKCPAPWAGESWDQLYEVIQRWEGYRE
ncbi:peptidoglycan recognition protein 1 isoform X1 [Cricetulus griseus]|uniref:peptidoglycan recognition protein 1 isoform X1 n=1 Tax=Cricetulus griseus TaxID=10029 RepID=UPI0015C34D0A|nr:peptidoglycan recognition protein 1 isoform X1 [Cricetulus griseus]